MRKYLNILIILAFSATVLVQPAQAQNRKLAQTSMKFLTVSTDARASALSGAMTALEGNSTALFYNPASMAGMNHTLHLSHGHVYWLAGIKYLFGTAAYSPAMGQYGVFAISLLAVDYGEFYHTIRADNEQGFLELDSFYPTAYALGIGYAKSLTNKFRIGGHIKYVQQNLGGGVVDFGSDQSAVTSSFSADVLAFDFGLIYRTGFKSLNFGMNIRNFSQEIEYIKESFQLPLLFEMGISMNLFDLSRFEESQHALTLSVDAIHPRDYEEQIDFGLEYVFMNSFALRMGYTTPTDEQGVALGFGLKHNFVEFDYAYVPFGVFNQVHRWSIHVAY